MRYVFFLLSVIGLGVMGSAQAEGEARPQVAKYGKVFQGSEGLVLWTVSVGDPANQEFLLQYSGVNHPWDMKIFKVKSVPSVRDGADYTLTVDGKDYVTLVERPVWGSEKSYEVYLPNGPKGMKVHYSETLSREMKPEHILTEYLEQSAAKK